MSTLYARFVVKLRWLVVLLWAAALVAVLLTTEPLGKDTGAIGRIAPDDAQALQAERLSAETFGFPLLFRSVLVRQERGVLTEEELREVLRDAAVLNRRARDLGILAAVPILNSESLFPGTRAPGSTALIAVRLTPDALNDAFTVLQRAQRLITRPGEDPYQVTGTAVAREAEAEFALDRLWLIELATGALVLLVVGLHLRSLVAPLVTLGIVVLTYLIAVRVVGWAARELGFSAPQEVRPVIVALIFGVVTDYCVFFFGRLRQALDEERDERRAVVQATAGVVGIVTVAAFAVIGASAALLVGEVAFFDAFGPGMAFAVAIAWLVVVTLLPAAAGILRGRVLAPHTAPPARRRRREERRVERRRRLTGATVRHPWVTTALCLLLLGGAIGGLARLDLSGPVIEGLPTDSAPVQGLRAVADAYPTGVVAPTEVLVRGEGVGTADAALERLERQIEARPGVAGVIAPSDLPASAPQGLLRSERADVARLLVVLRTAPLTADSLEVVDRLKADLPDLLGGVGLPAADALVAGDTALTLNVVELLASDFLKVAAVVLGVLFVILAVYLRALVAPLYLLATSVLALLAALGLTAWFFGELTGDRALVYVVPISASVLLAALGSDYNVFLAGRVWREARQRPFREAIVEAGARAGGAISAAGLVLAASFALLAIIPLLTFRQLAFAMGVGLLIDAFLVRTLLVPALMSLAGERSGWPGSRLAEGRRRSGGRLSRLRAGRRQAQD